jgi:cobalamin synthase
LIGYGLALHRAYKSLDGMNGDISGYALTLDELAAAAVFALL